MRKILIFLFVIFIFCPYLYAQEGSNRDEEVKKLKEEMKLLQAQFEQKFEQKRLDMSSRLCYYFEKGNTIR